jgi:hypothetical protein
MANANAKPAAVHDHDIQYNRFYKFFPMLEDMHVEWLKTNSAPVNVDVPYVSGAGSVGEILNCTVGNWHGEPTEYAYAWKASGAAVGANDANYTVTAADAGKSVACTVTATNDKGSTIAPPSNAVLVMAARAAPAPAASGAQAAGQAQPARPAPRPPAAPAAAAPAAPAAAAAAAAAAAQTRDHERAGPPSARPPIQRPAPAPTPRRE